MSGPVSLCACALVGSGVCPVSRTPRHGVGAYPLSSRQHLCTSRRLRPVCRAGPRWRFLGPSTQRAEDRRPYSPVPCVDIDELVVVGLVCEELGTFYVPTPPASLRIPLGDGFIILTFPGLLCFSRGVGAGLFVALRDEYPVRLRSAGETNTHLKLALA